VAHQRVLFALPAERLDAVMRVGGGTPQKLTVEHLHLGGYLLGLRSEAHWKFSVRPLLAP
jgi:hypothetical protein